MQSNTHGDHLHHADHDFDPGTLYTEPWVQGGVRKIQENLLANLSWIGMDDESKSQRVLDYACGNGAVSTALAKVCPNAVFHGIDIHPKQVERYDHETAKLFGDSQNRLRAVQGDLMNPSPALNEQEWYNFDVVIMSMALHHVFDPVEMLRRIGQRLKTGGTVVIIDWLQDEAEVSSTNGGVAEYNQAEMIEVVGKQRIRPGFSFETIKGMMTTAGFGDVEFKVCEGTFRVPEHGNGGKGWRENRMFFTRALWL